MAKALTEPLFLLLLGLLVVQLAAWIPRGSGSPRWGIRLGLLALTLALWFAATPAAVQWVMGPLERPHADYEGLDGWSPHAVVVLSAGMWSGPRPELDLPTGATAARVARGVEVFQQSGARYLVVTGGVRRPGGESGDLARLMARQAERLGVPGDRILVEPRAANTRAHPPEVAALPEIEADRPVAVVTSAFHLPRAIREFERHFARVRPVPAEFLAPADVSFFRRWLPSSERLWQTTRATHEYVGRLWYALLAWREER